MHTSEGERKNSKSDLRDSFRQGKDAEAQE